MLFAVINGKVGFTLAQIESGRRRRWRKHLSIELLLTAIARDMMFRLDVNRHALPVLEAAWYLLG